MRWDSFEDYLVGMRLGVTTRRRYLRWVRDADEWLTEHGRTLDDATATHVAVWAEERVVGSHASRGQAAAALRHYWDWTQRDRAPFRAIPVPPAPEYECRAVSEDEAEWLIHVASGWWPEGGAVLVGMTLALRRFEIAKMEWSRFEQERTWYRVTGKYGKTKLLPVHPHLQAELAGRENGSPWVFPGRFGSHVNPATIWDWVRRVGQAAGIPDLEPHELRHTALATVNDELGDLRAVQTFARHSKPSTTAIYTRTTAKRLREVSDALTYLNEKEVNNG